MITYEFLRDWVGWDGDNTILEIKTKIANGVFLAQWYLSVYTYTL